MQQEETSKLTCKIQVICIVMPLNMAVIFCLFY